jgi:hypothetical protein
LDKSSRGGEEENDDETTKDEYHAQNLSSHFDAKIEVETLSGTTQLWRQSILPHTQHHIGNKSRTKKDSSAFHPMSSLAKETISTTFQGLARSSAALMYDPALQLKVGPPCSKKLSTKLWCLRTLIGFASNQDDGLTIQTFTTLIAWSIMGLAL